MGRRGQAQRPGAASGSAARSARSWWCRCCSWVTPGSVVHVRPSPAGGQGHGRAATRASSRPRPLGRAESSQDGKAASQGRRRTPAAEASRTCFASHLPPEIPQPAPRGVLARGCRQVFGLMGTEASGLLLVRRFPGPWGSQCFVAGSFPVTAAGQRRNGPPRRRASPASLFIQRVAPAGTDGHNISWLELLSTQNLVEHARAGTTAPPPAQGRCWLARYSALRISISREAVRSNSAARRLPAYSATGSA